MPRDTISERGAAEVARKRVLVLSRPLMHDLERFLPLRRNDSGRCTRARERLGKGDRSYAKAVDYTVSRPFLSPNELSSTPISSSISENPEYKP